MKYDLRIVRNGVIERVVLSEQQVHTLMAENDTLYQITDENGNLIAGVQVKMVGDDAWVYLPNASQPILLLKHYQTHHPIVDAEKLAQLNSTLATGAAEVLVAPVGILAVGLGTLTVGAVALASGSGGSDNAPAAPTQPTAPTQPKDITPPSLSVNMNKINEIITDASQNYTVSGSLKGSETLKNQQIIVNVNGVAQTATITGETWVAEFDGATFTKNQGENRISATFTAQNLAGNGAKADAVQTYMVDTVEPELAVAIHPMSQIVSDASQNYTVSGSLKGSETLKNQQIIVNVNGVAQTATITGETWVAEFDGATFTKNQGENRISATFTAQDLAGNGAKADAMQTYTVDTVKPELAVAIHPMSQIVSDASQNYTVSGSLKGSETLKNQQIIVNVNGVAQTATITGETWTAKFDGATFTKNQGENRISATFTAQDLAGNGAKADAVQTYTVDTIEPELGITINPISDGVINLAESRQKHTLSGSLSANETVQEPQVVIALNGQDYVADVAADGKSWSLTLDGNILAQNQGSNSVSATYTAKDSAGHLASSQKIMDYHVDTSATNLRIHMNAIEQDGIINQHDAQQDYLLSGSIEFDQTTKNPSVVLNINGENHNAKIDGKTWSFLVSGSLLVKNQGEQSIIATLHAQDIDGVAISSSVSQKYQVDTKIDQPVIVFNQLAGDDVLNLLESQAAVLISGTVMHAQNGDKVKLTIGNATEEVRVENGTFSLSVAGETLKNHNSIQAEIITRDEAGNTATAIAHKHYTVDVDAPAPTIHLNPITSDNVIDFDEWKQKNTQINGNIGHYSLTDNNKVILRCVCESCSGTVLEKVIDATLNQDGTFTADVNTSELVKYDTVTAEIISTDAAQNTGKNSHTQKFTVSARPSITLNQIADDNIINVAEFNYGSSHPNIAITGSISQSDVANSTVVLQFSRSGSLKKEIAVELDDNGVFVTKMSGAELHREYDSVTAVLRNNLGEFTATQNYKAAAYSPRWDALALTEVSGDNVLDAQDTWQKTSRVKGHFSSIRNTATAEGIENWVQLNMNINNKMYSQTVNGQTGQFEFEVATADLLADSDKIIDLTAILRDTAGNTGGNKTAALSYRIEDVHINQPDIHIAPIANINKMHLQNHPQTTLSGSLKTDGDVSDANTVMHININGVNHRVYRNGDEWSLTVPTADLVAAQGKITAHIQATDHLGNTASNSNIATYLVDVLAPEVHIGLNPIAEDNVIDANELTDVFVVSGKVTGEYQISDKVHLNVGTQSFSVAIGADGVFSQDIEKSLILQNNQISGSLKTMDALGNESTATTNEYYSVVAQDVQIVLNSVTHDNVLNVSEQFDEITLSGSLKGSDAQAGQSVALMIGQEKFIAIVDKDLNFSAKVSGSLLAQNDDYVIHAQALNKQGELQASSNHHYQVDANVAAGIRISHVGDNALGVGEQYAGVRLSGKLNFHDSIFQQGYNEDAIKAVEIKIGDKTWVSGFNREDFSFHIDLSQAEYAQLAGQPIEHRFLVSNVNIYHLTGSGSLKTINSTNAKSSDLAKNELAKITLDWNNDGLTASINQQAVVGNHVASSEIKGTVFGSAQTGDTVWVQVGHTQYETQVLADKTFRVQVSHSDLAAHQGKPIVAQLATHDLSKKAIQVHDVASFSETHHVGDAMVNQHQANDVTTRHVVHTDANYNFPYMIDAVRNNVGHSGGFLSFSKTPFGGFTADGGTVKLKYYFANEAQDYSQGWEYCNANYVREGSFTDIGDVLKNMIRTMLTKFSDVANIEWVEVFDRNDIQNDGIIFMRADMAGVFASSGAFAFEGGMVVFDNRNFADVAADNISFYKSYLVLHEVFHTFGGYHTDGYYTKLDFPKWEDYTSEFSVMSYGNGYHNAQSYRDLSLYDIMYMHYRFGVNPNINAGNDVYGFGHYASLVNNGTIYIADGGGVDTFDASAETEGVTVNLTPGSWIYHTSQLSNQFIIDNISSIDSGRAYFADQNLADDVHLSGSLTGYKHVDYVAGQGFIGYGTQIENLNGSQFDDVLIGNKADNNISGNGGDDYIEGGLGHDYLDGGMGADTMIGGEGDDRYVVDDEGDKVIENENEGNDWVYSHIDYVLGNHLEHIQLLGADNLNATGNALNNIMMGNSGDNVLNGGMGDDVLDGGRGSDTLTGGAGKDAFVFSTVLDGSMDTITDFNVAEDVIRLSSAVFGALHLGMDNVRDYVHYDSQTGKMGYDADVKGVVDAVYFAQLSVGLDETQIRYEVI